MHQPASLDPTSKPEAVLPGVGEIDAFELAACPRPELDRGRKVRCTSIRSLLYYVCSASARKVSAVEHVPGMSVRLQIEGPITHDQSPLRTAYTITRHDLLPLSGAQMRLLEERLDALYGGHVSAPASPSRRLRETLAPPSD